MQSVFGELKRISTSRYKLPAWGSGFSAELMTSFGVLRSKEASPVVEILFSVTESKVKTFFKFLHVCSLPGGFVVSF